MAEPEAPARWRGYRVVTAAEMQAIDRRAIQERGVPALELMENAGRGVAEIVLGRLAEAGRPRGRIAAVCGRGNNGGDGLVAARRLKARGVEAEAWLLSGRREPGPEVRANLERALAAGVAVRLVPEGEGPPAGALSACDLLIDALLGTGSRGAPAGSVKLSIEALVAAGRPVLAVDLPSGLDPDTGEARGACVRAEVTAALGLPKRGLLEPRAKDFVGELIVLDIGFPRELTQ